MVDRPAPPRRLSLPHRLALALAAATTLVAVAACGSSSPAASGPDSTTTTEGAVSGDVTVYAAQSLSGAFTELAELFEQRHPGTSVKLNLNGSSTLVTQITQGAPADVFASADQANMQKVVDAGLAVGTPEVFAHNLLQIVVEKGNPKGLTGLDSLDDPGVTVDLCAAEVPCGNYARQSLTKGDVTVNPVSDEKNVAAVVTRVANGEADAGIVYRTDVLANDKVAGVDIPADQNVVAEYPLVIVKDAPNPAGGAAFAALAESPDGQAILARYGFQPL
jgi:molybdate transport system substrate-binding protein